MRVCAKSDCNILPCSVDILGRSHFFFEEKGISSFWGRVKKGEGIGRTGTSRGRETVVGMKCMREE